MRKSSLIISATKRKKNSYRGLHLTGNFSGIHVTLPTNSDYREDTCKVNQKLSESRENSQMRSQEDIRR